MDPQILLDLLLKWEEEYDFVRETPFKADEGEIVFRIDIEEKHFQKLQFLREINAPEHQILTVEIDQQVNRKDLITLRIRVTFFEDDYKLEYGLGKTPENSTVDIWAMGQRATDLLDDKSRRMLVPKLDLSPLTRLNSFREFDDPKLLKVFL